MPLTTVLIADLEKAGRAACRRLLQPEKQIKVVGEAQSGFEAATAAANLTPHVLLLGLTLAQAQGGSLVSTILGKSPRTRIILLTHRASEHVILDALSQGALGYLPKKGLPPYLAKAVRAVNAGQAWVPRMMVRSLVARLARLAAQA